MKYKCFDCKKEVFKYEKRFKSYLFNGDIKRFKLICKEIGIINNINCLKELEREELKKEGSFICSDCINKEMLKEGLRE